MEGGRGYLAKVRRAVKEGRYVNGRRVGGRRVAVDRVKLLPSPGNPSLNREISRLRHASINP